ncbi:hypothetical protein RJ55_04247 [Drechmeria coniospora]|nr:hypothetical protein RJ55_04247 [Drechmeria coniospora]
MMRILFLLGLATLSLSRIEKKRFDWASITPSRDLEYYPCYDAFKCARLILPLDWLNASDTRTIALAVIKLPALVANSDATFAGPILTNPGGPGGSGVDFLKYFGHRLRNIVDEPGKRHYEIVSFDPRGISNSWPRTDCFPGDMLARDALRLEMRGSGPLDGSSGAVPYMLGLQDAFGQRCRAAESEGLNGGHIMEFASTPSVARDMVEMVDKMAELRKREGQGDDGRGAELRKRHDRHDDDEDDVPRLQYIGFSYGTILGNYFASMFPERIGRLVLDGVANADDYSNGPGWLTNLVDSDKIVNAFFSGCHSAGRHVCPLVRDGDESGSDIEARFHVFLSAIDEDPISGMTAAGMPVVVRSRDVREVMGSVLYRPLQQFKLLASALDGLMTGNATQFIKKMEARGSLPSLRDSCQSNGNGSEAEVDRSEGGQAVLCGDGDSLVGKGAGWWRRYVDKQVAMSSLMGAYWSRIRIRCSSWTFRTNWSFKGPFTSPRFERSARGRPVKGKPAAAILFLSNRLDPVTPLKAARAMAAKHPDAGVLVQEALGHCALASGDSHCTTKAVREYLDSGVIPSGDKSCEIKCGPWDEDCSIDGVPHALQALNMPQQQRFPPGLSF